MLSSSSYSHRAARVHESPLSPRHKKQKSVVKSKNGRGIAVTAMGSGGLPAKDRKLRWSSDVDQWEKPDFTSASDSIALNRTMFDRVNARDDGEHRARVRSGLPGWERCNREFSQTGTFILELKLKGCDFLPKVGRTR